MFDNLAAYGLNNGIENGLTVETLLQELEQFSSSYNKNENEFAEIARELEVIKKEVLAKEKQFYNKIGLNSFEELNGEIKRLENKFEMFLPNGSIMREIRERFDFTQIKNATDEELAEAVKERVNFFLTEEVSINDKLQKEIVEVSDVHRLIQQNLRTENGRFITSRSHGSDAKKVGLGRIVYRYNKKANSVEVDVGEIKHLSNGFKRKLEKDLVASYLNKNKQDNKINVFDLGENKKEAIQIYRNYIDEIIRRHYGEPIDVVKNQYDLNRSLSSTIGYLGEIRATLFIKKLAPDADVRATGNLRKATDGKGQEIPIDLVCAANGFQIKNYTLDNNQVTFSGAQQAPTWVEGRLQFTSNNISQALIGLFGTYQYNQPLSDSLLERGHSLPGDLAFYESVYMKIEQMFNDLKPLFDTRIPHILKIRDLFSVEGDSLFGERKLYFNTFFWINKHLVPSSWILDKLIQQLSSKSKMQQIITSSYSFSNSKHDSFRFQIKGWEHQQLGKAPGTMRQAAERVRASYQITIDLSEFANL